MHVRKATAFTFDELWEMSRTHNHCAHMEAFYAARYAADSCNEDSDSAWSGMEEYYHRGVDPRNWQPA